MSHLRIAHRATKLYNRPEALATFCVNIMFNRFIKPSIFAKKLQTNRKKLLVLLSGLVILGSLLFLMLVHVFIGQNRQYILNPRDEAAIWEKHIVVGIVLGAGINADGKPYRELQARLDLAAEALNKGYVDKLILSGDNRSDSYNEPQAMKNYLINSKHLLASQLQVDNAGRSSYESCERASKVFGIRQTIIFSARSHLPRAIFLCRHFGVEAYGIASEIEANNSLRREILAGGKALFNVYIYGEKTILGEPISL